MSKFQLEVAKLKEILLKNGYPRKIIDAWVFKFLNNFFEPKPVTLTVPKKRLFIVLPFMGNMSGLIKTGLSKALQKGLHFCKLRVIFKSTNRLKSYFNFKDVLPEPTIIQYNYDHAKHTNLRAEAAALPILAKPFGI